MEQRKGQRQDHGHLFRCRCQQEEAADTNGSRHGCLDRAVCQESEKEKGREQEVEPARDEHDPLEQGGVEAVDEAGGDRCDPPVRFSR